MAEGFIKIGGHCYCGHTHQHCGGCNQRTVACDECLCAKYELNPIPLAVARAMRGESQEPAKH